jgi:predicted AAA+ superfamily ATPase
MIERQLRKIIEQKYNTGKAIIVLGPHQTGKTTLIESILSGKGSFLILNCDDPFIRTHLGDANTETLKQIIGPNKIVFIDEAQRVKNIGLTLKLITDSIKGVHLLVSGSSALELANEINEPLTGRKWEYLLYPVSWLELYNHAGFISAMQQLEQRIVYGMYPEVINGKGNVTETLKEITGSYLYKDLLSYKGIRKPEILEKLLKALAFQIGNQVSYNELAKTVQVDKNTINTYIDLLEKAFVIFRLQPLSRNLRNEISTSRKIYFYDTGIRNSIINNLNPFEYRNDIGVLWENFIIAERIKHNSYNAIYAKIYFWRSHQHQEIDYIEERNGKLFAYEFKWNENKTKKFPAYFIQSYPDSEIQIINNRNFLPFLGIK